MQSAVANGSLAQVGLEAEIKCGVGIYWPEHNGKKVRVVKVEHDKDYSWIGIQGLLTGYKCNCGFEVVAIAFNSPNGVTQKRICAKVVKE